MRWQWLKSKSMERRLNCPADGSDGLKYLLRFAQGCSSRLRPHSYQVIQ
jgi:hypothetical protein